MKSTATASDYDMLEQIGKGAYGTVCKARVKATNQIVAIKKIQLEQDWLPLLSEINMVIDLTDDTIINYYNYFFNGNELWLVMEYCDGGSLSDIMEYIKRQLNEQEISALCRGVLKGLIYIHSKNRIHRDIKAANLLLTSNGDVKLCDFGVSAQLDNSEAAKTLTKIGSPNWMAPEVIQATGTDTKADIWSLGITALELYKGEPPFSDIVKGVYFVLNAIVSNPPPKAPNESSTEFKNFVSRCLNKKPDLRPTALELIKDPFINLVSEHNAKEIISKLVEDYKTAKANAVDETEEVEEEEEEEEVEVDCDFNDDAVKTILFSNESNGTFIPCDTGTMIVQNQGQNSGQKQGGLSNWTPVYLDDENKNNATAFKQAQKRHFRNFTADALKALLTSMRDLALSEIQAGKIPEKDVRNNYNEVREGIVAELRRKEDPSKYPDDYQALP